MIGNCRSTHVLIPKGDMDTRRNFLRGIGVITGAAGLSSLGVNIDKLNAMENPALISGARPVPLNDVVEFRTGQIGSYALVLNGHRFEFQGEVVGLESSGADYIASQSRLGHDPIVITPFYTSRNTVDIRMKVNGLTWTDSDC